MDPCMAQCPIAYRGADAGKLFTRFNASIAGHWVCEGHMESAETRRWRAMHGGTAVGIAVGWLYTRWVQDRAGTSQVAEQGSFRLV